MQLNFNDTSFLYPQTVDVDMFVKQSALGIFSDAAIEFLNALSQELRAMPSVRSLPDVATFSFFCRKANILNMKTLRNDDSIVRLGRGVVFHIAPSNVPVNFAYTLICGILSGNVNIVRVPSKDFEQVSVIIKAISAIAAKPECQEIAKRILLVRYERQSTATSEFSSLCDVRVIWGGDDTIEQIRKNALPPRSYDITFADRYSLCVINADEYVHETKPEAVAQGFYNDTYLFDQNACTAPHLVVWLGSTDNVAQSQAIFWEQLHGLVKQKYQDVQPVIAVDKLTALYNQAAISGVSVSKSHADDNLLWRVTLDTLPANIDEFRCSSGYFSEYHATALADIARIITRKYQTVAHYGLSVEQLKTFVTDLSPAGVDRYVPIGKTTDFSLVWDGYDLIGMLSRCVVIA